MTQIENFVAFHRLKREEIINSETPQVYNSISIHNNLNVCFLKQILF